MFTPKQICARQDDANAVHRNSKYTKTVQPPTPPAQPIQPSPSSPSGGRIMFRSHLPQIPAQIRTTCHFVRSHTHTRALACAYKHMYGPEFCPHPPVDYARSCSHFSAGFAIRTPPNHPKRSVCGERYTKLMDPPKPPRKG